MFFRDFCFAAQPNSHPRAPCFPSQLSRASRPRTHCGVTLLALPRPLVVPSGSGLVPPHPLSWSTGGLCSWLCPDLALLLGSHPSCGPPILGPIASQGANRTHVGAFGEGVQARRGRVEGCRRCICGGVAVWWHRQGAEVVQAMWAVPGRGFVIDDLMAPPLCLPRTTGPWQGWQTLLGDCLPKTFPSPLCLPFLVANRTRSAWAPGFLQVVRRLGVAAHAGGRAEAPAGRGGRESAGDAPKDGRVGASPYRWLVLLGTKATLGHLGARPTPKAGRAGGQKGLRPGDAGTVSE